MFHALCRGAADRFMGPARQARPGYAIICRGLDHGQVRRLCGDLQVHTLKSRRQGALGVSSVSQPMRDFAKAFAPLQDARHRADYYPAALSTPSDVDTLMIQAEAAIADFHTAPPPERADILALLLVGTRTCPPRL